MFQSFTATTRPEQGPQRLALLRAELAARGLVGFIVPRADAHQGEYVAPSDERLAWLTGFTGSAGFCVVLAGVGGGVYRRAVSACRCRDQIDLGAFTPVAWPDTGAADWLRTQIGGGAVIGFDPWLHTPDEIAKIEAGLAGRASSARAGGQSAGRGLDRPAATRVQGRVRVHPLALAGRSGADKRAELAAGLKHAGVAATVITLADSLAWLMNWRGSDIIRNPVVQGFAVLHDDARLDLFIDPAKVAHLPDEAGVTRHQPAAFANALRALNGVVRFDPATAPMAVASALAQGAPGADPCLMAKAGRTPPNWTGMRAAHRRDGAAMVEFLCWYDAQASGRADRDRHGPRAGRVSRAAQAAICSI